MEDIKNIRVSEKANNVLEKLVKDQHLFRDDITAARFAFSFAIDRDLDASTTEDYYLGVNTINKWDVGGFDTTGAMRLLIEMRHPKTECPYRMMQAVINVGLEGISKQLPESGLVKISVFM